MLNKIKNLINHKRVNKAVLSILIFILIIASFSCKNSNYDNFPVDKNDIDDTSLNTNTNNLLIDDVALKCKTIEDAENGDIIMFGEYFIQK